MSENSLKPFKMRKHKKSVVLGNESNFVLGNYVLRFVQNKFASLLKSLPRTYVQVISFHRKQKVSKTRIPSSHR